MSQTGISTRVIIAIALLLCVFPENNGIATGLIQPYETFPAGSAPAAIAIEKVDNDGKNDVALLPEESFLRPLFIPAIVAGKRKTGLVCTANPNGAFESGHAIWSEHSDLGFEVITNGFPPVISPHTGSFATWLGCADSELSFIVQQLPISPSCFFLTFYHLINSFPAFWIISADGAIGVTARTPPHSRVISGNKKGVTH